MDKLLLPVAILWVVGILLVPFGALLYEVFRDLPAVFVGITSPEALRALGMSVVMAAAAVIINGVLGVAAALVIVRHRFPGRALLDAAIDLPLAVSPVMTGLAFLLLFGREGWLRPVLEVLNFKVAFAWPGVLLATLFVTMPFVVRELVLVLREIGEDEELAASTLGASAWQTFWRVTLPNLRHGVSLGATLTAARALGEFGAVLVLGGAIAGRTRTATTFIHAAMEERQAPAAYGMALALGALAAGLLALLSVQKHPR